jgi:hypothetical protein
MSHRNLIGILDNFLGTYTSRYSDFNGYWLFGMLINDLGELRIDLLSSNETSTENGPKATARQVAVQKFREQMDKAGFSVSRAQQAHLDVSKLPDLKNGFVNGQLCPGYNVRFVAKIVLKTGKMYEREKSVFVAPHDSQVEQRNRLS